MAKEVKELFKVHSSEEQVEHVEILADDPKSSSKFILVTTNKRVLKVKL